MLTPARTRASLAMAEIALAPPMEWPAMPMRFLSIRRPYRAISWSTTKDTSFPRPVLTRRRSASVWALSHATQVNIRPAGNIVPADS